MKETKVKRKLKDQKAITLIALVITIIVLLILAAVSIATLTGNNGILIKATDAKDETIIAEEKEQVELAYISAKINKQIENVTFKDLQNELDNSVGALKTNVTTNGNDILNVYFIETQHNYKVTNGVPSGPETEEVVRSIYAKLYTDGTLILSSTDYTDDSRVLAKNGDFGDISNDNYYSNEETGEFNFPGWINEDDWINIATNIVIMDKIYPTDSVAVWFLGFSGESLELSKLDTRYVTNMSGMFAGCSNLTGLDLSNFNTSNVTNMSGMFSGCSNLTGLDLSNFNTRNVTDMSWMFAGCSNLTGLDLSNFTATSLTEISAMFFECSNLTSLDFGDFNPSNITDMSDVFYRCRAISDYSFLNNWKVDKVETFESFWGNIGGEGFACTEIDISSWNINIDYIPTDVRTFFIQNTSVGDITLYVKNSTIKELLENNTMNAVICIVK